ncbi:MAG: biotin transporter BioY [Holosporales bacterium]|jgi:biotin transport system substrate-specific component|nr:biotin transporter BioY [Holosporales bacterium]
MEKLAVSQNKAGWLNTVYVVLGSLFIALSAQITVPSTPVPMTMQVYAVLLVGGLLGGKRGFASVMLYLAEGACGLPVFAGGASGLGMLCSARGGYLIGMPIAAGLVGYMTASWHKESFLKHLTAGLTGLTAIYIPGVTFVAVALGDFWQALAVGFIPFLVADTLKILLFAGSMSISKRLRK